MDKRKKESLMPAEIPNDYRVPDKSEIYSLSSVKFIPFISLYTSFFLSRKEAIT